MLTKSVKETSNLENLDEEIISDTYEKREENGDGQNKSLQPRFGLAHGFGVEIRQVPGFIS